jgi:hypothetical protein
MQRSSQMGLWYAFKAKCTNHAMLAMSLTKQNDWRNCLRTSDGCPRYVHVRRDQCSRAQMLRHPFHHPLVAAPRGTGNARKVPSIGYWFLSYYLCLYVCNTHNYVSSFASPRGFLRSATAWKLCADQSNVRNLGQIVKSSCG